MFCVNCGVAVSGGASFCAGCGHPVSASDAASVAAMKEGRKFRYIRIMNIVGAAGIALLWLVLFTSMLSRMSPLLFGVFFVVALITVGTPAVSALAFSNKSGGGLRALAIGLNIALIMLWIFGMVGEVLHTPFSLSSTLTSLFGAVFYVVPAVVNIWALRAFKSAASTAAAPA